MATTPAQAPSASGREQRRRHGERPRPAPVRVARHGGSRSRPATRAPRAGQSRGEMAGAGADVGPELSRTHARAAAFEAELEAAAKGEMPRLAAGRGRRPSAAGSKRIGSLRLRLPGRCAASSGPVPAAAGRRSTVRAPPVEPELGGQGAAAGESRQALAQPALQRRRIDRRAGSQHQGDAGRRRRRPVPSQIWSSSGLPPRSRAASSTSRAKSSSPSFTPSAAIFAGLCTSRTCQTSPARPSAQPQARCRSRP